MSVFIISFIYLDIAEVIRTMSEVTPTLKSLPGIPDATDIKTKLEFVPHVPCSLRQLKWIIELENDSKNRIKQVCKS